MTYSNDWAEFISRIEYKPGWEFLHSIAPDGREQLEIVMQVLDSRGSGQTIPVRLGQSLMSFDDAPEDYHIHYVRQLIQDLEMHEVHEWYKLDGELVFDPHKNG